MYSSYKIVRYIDKLKLIAREAFGAKNYEKSLAAISACANILYYYNQYYVDFDLEKILLDIANETITKIDQICDDNTILFYDGFGLDNRGIASNITLGIVKNDYKLIYVTQKYSIDKQPLLKEQLNGYDVEYCYIDTIKGYANSAKQIYEIVCKYKPKFSFLYTYPSDVSGIVAFNAIKGLSTRLQVDLTDHAFWLGINAFDYISSGREYSASIQIFYRNIDIKKLVYIDLAALPIIPKVKYKGLPFDENSHFVFSGGALYKTFGDKNNTFYRMVDYILSRHKEIIYYYIGDGDTTELNKLKIEFPNRVFYSRERKDFFEVCKRCLFLLNTYPMFGGMMMRYAALAGKLPLTLKHNNESQGILFEQEKRRIEYESLSQMLKDIDRIIEDVKYRKEREKKLVGSVFNERQFVNNIKAIIETCKSLIDYDFNTIEKIDTKQFRNEYLNRFEYNIILSSLTRRRNYVLALDFPMEFLLGSLYKFIKSLRRLV